MGGNIHLGHSPGNYTGRVPQGGRSQGHFRILPILVGEANICTSSEFPSNEILLLWESQLKNYLPTLIYNL